MRAAWRACGRWRCGLARLWAGFVSLGVWGGMGGIGGKEWRREAGEREGMKTHRFIRHPHVLQAHASAELVPLLAIRGIEVHCIVTGPVDPRGFYVSHVGYVAELLL